MYQTEQITFTLHNKEHTVNASDVTPETTLVQYLRDYEHLKGTKYMCLEGGCGACIVAVTAKHPLTKKTITFAVNSCLVSIYSCQGWAIHTIDGIGNEKIGYHPIQETLAKFNGTQCGFCSPGMVMNMYPLYESKNTSKKNVEDSFGGNLCRCTGYRPILSAMKTLVENASCTNVLHEYPDIEDLGKCGRTKRHCSKQCIFLGVSARPSVWFKVTSVNEIFDVLDQNPEKSYRLVAGNTARGVYHPTQNPDVYIDITSVTNLINNTTTNNSIIIGANKELNDTVDLFRKTAKNNANFAYLDKLADHIELVAHVPVRNIGTLAGNLSIKHEHNEFPSDIFLILTTADAKLTIVNSDRTEKQYSLTEYLSLDMNRKVIKKIILPSLDSSYKYGSYKIMPRAQNAHAMVNAGFLIKLDKKQTVQSANIIYGGINPSFVHATNAEQYLIGKQLFDNKTLQGVFSALDDEIKPNIDPPQPKPAFRKNLAISLFYKFVLNIAPNNKVSPQNRTGGILLTRPISTGIQEFQSNASKYPLTEPIPKLEALKQTSGEVEYIIDMPERRGELFAYFVVAKAEANSLIQKIDPSEALKLDGVVKVFNKNDIPGKNTFTPKEANFPSGALIPQLPFVEEELFCSGVVKYYNQPIALVVAISQEVAEKAAELVKVTYSPGKKKPLFTIKQILDANAKDKIYHEGDLKAKRKGKDTKNVVKGTYETNWQYHFHMETQICIVVPKEDSLDVYPGTQWKDLIQVGIAKLLNINENKINVFVKRIGGAYGAKITRNSMIACAVALAAHKLQVPVRMRMTFTTNMDVIGKRYPSYANYEVGLNSKGEIQYLDHIYYLDYAAASNVALSVGSMDIFYSSYKHDTWNVSANSTTSDNHPGTFVRAPGVTNTMAMIETIMEHIAMELGMSPWEIRMANMDKKENKDIIRFMKDLKEWSNYDNRLKQIQRFNENNRWVKQGLSLVPMTFPLVPMGGYTSMVTIYASDGTVAVTHGGIEIGQGIDTKVAQVCAYAFGISLDMVSIKPSNNVVAPNDFATSRSTASEAVCYATLKSCQILLDRMKPVRDKMKKPTWKQLVKKSQEEYIELVANYMYNPNEVQSYNIYGVCATEVEVDILTGVHQVKNVHLLEDTGESISPCVDVGQVEGAFIMGLGYWTTEKIVFDKQGKLLTNRTWNYKPPGALDIPINFQVKFPKNNPNPVGVLSSKASGEPSLCLACSIPIAIRHAVASARKAADAKADKWYPIRGPSTVENTFMNSLNDYSQYTL